MDMYIDDFRKHKKEMNETGIEDCCEMTPVDLYGHRINLDKNDTSNFEKTAKSIQEDYGLESY